MEIRIFLQNGEGRHIFSKIIPRIIIVLALIISIFLYLNNKSWSYIYIHANDFFKYACALSAALAVMTYNLRTKAIDFYRNNISNECSEKRDFEEALISAKKTLFEITNITLLAFFCSALLGFSSILCNSHSIPALIITSITLGLFFSCISEYIYVLFCIEKIESTMFAILAQRCFLTSKDNSNKKDLPPIPDTKLPSSWETKK